MDRQEAIRLLNEDIRDEHGAIILYLRTAYALGEGEVAAEIEGIAREEMRHFKWLSEEVVRLGGTPTTERAEVGTAETDPVALMRLAVASEKDAADNYEAHAAAMDEPRLAGLLRRIAVDERAHRRDFEGLLAKVESAPAAAEEEAAAGETSAAEAEPLQEHIALEYTTLLQYLQQSFLTPHCALSKDLLDQAIVEMTHMGWLAEHVAESGATPRLEHGELAVNSDPEQILQTNIAVEAEVEEVYRRQLATTEDSELREILQRILDHSEYHETHFQELLAALQEQRKAAAAEAPVAPPRPGLGWTVGSLFGRKQE